MTNMSKQKNDSPLNIMEYYDWVAAQKFEGPKEHHQYVSKEEQDFLQYVVYPMFYQDRERKQFKTSIPFPLVLKDYSSRHPKYVIDNSYFTIIFFAYDNYDDEMCWEVSVHIKDHNFCDERLLSFAKWFRRYHISDSRLYYIHMDGMPKEFLYPKLELYGNEVQDFCIEFWNTGRDFMLFKLLDLLRLF